MTRLSSIKHKKYVVPSKNSYCEKHEKKPTLPIEIGTILGLDMLLFWLYPTHGISSHINVGANPYIYNNHFMSLL